MKRLILFAAYDALDRVGPSLVWHVKAMAACGDVVLAADSDIPSDTSSDGSLQMLAPYVLHSEAERHHEYDFGSYKRAFRWASEHLDMDAYGRVYLVNDSVFGPVSDVLPCMERMEAMSEDAVGMVYNPHHSHPHMQTWFVCLKPQVFRSGWFADFLLSVEKLKDKNEVCRVYETGLTELIVSKGLACSGLFIVPGKGIYNDVLKLCRRGLPFFKKSAFTRHEGSLGGQLSKVLAMNPEFGELVRADARRLYGAEYVDAILSDGSVALALRYLKYLRGKL